MGHKLPIQLIEAEFSATDANRESRTVPMTFYAGARVLQFSWEKGLHHLTLSLDPGSVRLGYFSSGRAPFTLGHADANNPLATIGVIENARIDGSKAVADVRFSKRAEVDPIINDILDGITPNTSVAAKLHKLRETTKDGDALRSFVATDWEPYHVALVGVGADPGAHFSAVCETDCEIEFVGRAISPKEHMMEETTINAGEQARSGTDATQAALAADRARVAELTAISQQYTRMGGTADLNLSAAITDGTTADVFRRAAFDQLANRQEAVPTRGHAQVTRDERDTIRMNASAQVMALFDGKNRVENANEFRGMSVLRLAEELLTRSGTSVRGMSRSDIATLSMHATADFPYILADSARKQMLAAYSVAVPTYKAWAKASTTPDFKTMSRMRLSETPSFISVPEGAQISLGTMTESREQYAIATYGRGVSFTRQMLINDDLGAFNDLIAAFGYQASRLENKTVYAILNANGNMSDSTALFHANHGNLGTGAIGNTGLDAMFTAMAVQKGMDGTTVLNLSPEFLIVPAAKKSTALTAMMAVGPNVKTSDQNWFAGRLQVVADAELDGTSTSVWYAACNPAIAPAVEYAHLQGAEGPQILRKENEDAILGVQLYAWLDFGAKAVDWRPIYKSSGV